MKRKKIRSAAERAAGVEHFRQLLITQRKVGYVDRVKAIAEDLPAGVHFVDVAHDSWCPMLRGNGACACSPTIKVRS